MDKDFFINKVQDEYIKNGSSMYNLNQKYIAECINTHDNIEQINSTDIDKGYFYFLFYDLSGKSSRMEQFSPVLIIDSFSGNGTRYVYGVSFNFIPVTIRTLFFNNLFNYNLSVLDSNDKQDTMKQDPLDGINFTNIYKLLFSIGFEWSIRKFDMKLLNKIYKVNTDILVEFITMATSKFTGVNDNKLVDIWKKKISEQDERQQQMIKDMLADFKNIESELNRTHLTLTDKNENLEKSLLLIKNIL